MNELRPKLFDVMKGYTKQQFLKENEANIRECIGEAVPTIIMQKIAKNIKEVLITGKKSQKKDKHV